MPRTFTWTKFWTNILVASIAALSLVVMVLLGMDASKERTRANILARDIDLIKRNCDISNGHVITIPANYTIWTDVLDERMRAALIEKVKHSNSPIEGMRRFGDWVSNGKYDNREFKKLEACAALISVGMNYSSYDVHKQCRELLDTIEQHFEYQCGCTLVERGQ
jgi:hypothetical protein